MEASTSEVVKMMLRILKKFLMFLILGCSSVSTSEEDNLFDVLKVTNVPFPLSEHLWAAGTNTFYEPEIPEFTACYRYMIESYNTGWANCVMFGGGVYIDMMGFETGYEFFRYQSLGLVIGRKVPGGGTGGDSKPAGHHVNLPRNLQTGEWYNFCFAYSSSLQKMHVYANGLKITGHKYIDESEDPLPSKYFKDISIGKNFRGLFTDLQIYSSFFDENEMVTWTTGCERNDGDIYSWDVDRMTFDTTLNVSLVTRSQEEVCLDSKQVMQEPSKLAGQTGSNIYKPRIEGNTSYVGQVLEMVTDIFDKGTSECKDRCLRLNGYMVAVPQTQEEADFVLKILTEALTKRRFGKLHFGGESRIDDYVKVIPDLDARLLRRDALYPNGGYYTFYHPLTQAKMKPHKNFLNPAHATDSYPGQKCIMCFTGMWWNDGKSAGVGCLHVSCYELHENSACACLFPTEPTFNMRGLCKDAVMDTSYKLADHNKLYETRHYVGPKGWILSRNTTDKKWRMTHKSYPDLTLTMLEMDALPVGRHNWRINNNVCNQGTTNVQSLLISGCKEDEFTCDDGKCLNITQRCNNIEVICIYETGVTKYSL